MSFLARIGGELQRFVAARLQIEGQLERRADLTVCKVDLEQRGGIVMTSRLIWHVVGLAVASAVCYGVYLAWGQFPTWARGTDFNDLRIIAVFVLLVIALSVGEAIWSRLPKRPTDGLGGTKDQNSDN